MSDFYASAEIKKEMITDYVEEDEVEVHLGDANAMEEMEKYSTKSKSAQGWAIVENNVAHL